MVTLHSKNVKRDLIIDTDHRAGIESHHMYHSILITLCSKGLNIWCAATLSTIKNA